MGNITVTVDEKYLSRDIRLDRKAGANVLISSPYIDVRARISPAAATLVVSMVLEH